MNHDCTLTVIGSESTGNSYALKYGEQILLIEAGCKVNDVFKAINYKIKDVVGMIISHAHG